MRPRHGPPPVRFLVLALVLSLPLAPAYLAVLLYGLDDVLVYLAAQPGHFVYAIVAVLLMLGQALLLELLSNLLARALARRQA